MIAAGLITWAVIAVGAGLIIGRGLRIADEHQRNYPPPTPHPPLTQDELDATWQDDVDVLEQRVYDRLFNEMVAAARRGRYVGGADQ